jgi:hydroxylaminobenzene mutase
MVLFFLGLLTGCVIPFLTSPRLALAAHMEGLLNGIFLIVAGGVLWKELHLAERLASVSARLLLIAAYASWGFCLLAAVFGASKTLAIAGAGYSAAAWQELLVSAGLGIGALCILAASCLVIYGLRETSEGQ